MASRSHRPSLGAARSSAIRSRRLSRLRLGAALAAAALAAELCYIACASPRLAVCEVKLRGDPRVVQEVASLVELPANTNIFRAPIRLLAQQVEAAPSVRKAYVSRDFPDRLVVTIEHREPVAVIRGGERPLLVDPEGVVFSLRDEWGWGIPELVGPHLTQASACSKAAAAEIATLLGVLGALGPNPALRPTRLTFRGEADLEATIHSGPVAQLGAATDLEAKAGLLAETIGQIGADRVEYLNLSDPRTAYWRPRPGSLAGQVR